jgi:glucose/arabinose dehydrogenase
VRNSVNNSRPPARRLPRSWRPGVVGVLVAVALFGAACTSNPTTVGVDRTGQSSSSVTSSTSTPGVELSTTSIGATPPASPQSAIDDVTLELTEAGNGFDAPVLLMADPGGGSDLVVEQSGRVVRNDDDHTVVLDISGDVLFDGEQGLLGLAFHPDFPNNGLAYVNYVDRSASTVIEEFTVVNGRFDKATRRTILAIEQPARNHNGGMVAFGPDGYLWIGMGDGGGANDRFDQAQDPATLLGSMLRIDVDARADGAYGIPPDNPFAGGQGGAPEVWATGLRNPWRFSFDGDDMWIADVGQNEIEEINLVGSSEAGLNFGWPIMEGTRCFENEGCDPGPFVTPVVEYTHAEGCSITGGYVYRGDAIAGLSGQYFYADFCGGFLRSVISDGSTRDWTQQVGETAQVAGFGIGGDGELYVVSHGGSVYLVEQRR